MINLIDKSKFRMYFLSRPVLRLQSHKILMIKKVKGIMMLKGFFFLAILSFIQMSVVCMQYEVWTFAAAFGYG